MSNRKRNTKTDSKARSRNKVENLPRAWLLADLSDDTSHPIAKRIGDAFQLATIDLQDKTGVESILESKTSPHILFAIQPRPDSNLPAILQSLRMKSPHMVLRRILSYWCDGTRVHRTEIDGVETIHHYDLDAVLPLWLSAKRAESSMKEIDLSKGANGVHASEMNPIPRTHFIVDTNEIAGKSFSGICHIWAESHESLDALRTLVHQFGLTVGKGFVRDALVFVETNSRDKSIPDLVIRIIDSAYSEESLLAWMRNRWNRKSPLIFIGSFLNVRAADEIRLDGGKVYFLPKPFLALSLWLLVKKAFGQDDRVECG